MLRAMTEADPKPRSDDARVTPFPPALRPAVAPRSGRRRGLSLGAGLALLVAGAALVPVPAAAQAYLRNCLEAKGASATLADQCRRALDGGGLSARQQAGAWVNIGVALSEMGRDGDALAAFDRGVAADPNFGAGFINRALARARRGDTGGALDDWGRAIALAPGAAEPLVGRATLQLQRGQAAAALGDLDRAVRVAPQDPDAHYNRGLALSALGRGREAAEAFGRVLRIDPNDAAAHLQRGVALLTLDPSAALRDLDAALRISPNWAAAWATRGQAQEKLGRTEAASADYRRAFELGYQAPWLNRKIEALGG